MAAPSLSALFDFEGQFETAAQAVLEASGINAFISQQAQQLPGAYTGIAFDVGGAIDQLTFLPLGGQTTRTEQEFFRYNGTLELQVSVARDSARGPDQSGVDSFLAQCRGLIRAAFLQSQWPFDDTNLPYYRVSAIRPDGTTTGNSGPPRNEDVISLRFAVTFAIQPGAWPTGFPPT